MSDTTEHSKRILFSCACRPLPHARHPSASPSHTARGTLAPCARHDHEAHTPNTYTRIHATRHTVRATNNTTPKRGPAPLARTPPVTSITRGRAARGRTLAPHTKLTLHPHATHHTHTHTRAACYSRAHTRSLCHDLQAHYLKSSACYLSHSPVPRPTRTRLHHYPHTHATSTYPTSPHTARPHTQTQRFRTHIPPPCAATPRSPPQTYRAVMHTCTTAATLTRRHRPRALHAHSSPPHTQAPPSLTCAYALKRIPARHS